MQFPAFTSINEQAEFGKSLSAQIAEYIAKQIFQGVYQTGDHLKEEELAAQFQTSRAPVREALYLLQIEGLVERLPRRGTVIKAYTTKELRELYEVRLGLECMAMDRASEKWTPEAQARFSDVLDQMSESLGNADAQAYASLNDLFHQLLFDVAGNDMLWRMYRQLNNLLITTLHMSTQQAEQLQVSFEEHKAIVEALESQNFDEAKALLVANVQHGMDRALDSHK